MRPGRYYLERMRVMLRANRQKSEARGPIKSLSLAAVLLFCLLFVPYYLLCILNLRTIIDLHNMNAPIDLNPVSLQVGASSVWLIVSAAVIDCL